MLFGLSAGGELRAQRCGRLLGAGEEAQLSQLNWGTHLRKFESLAYRQKIEKISGIIPNVSTSGRSFSFTLRRNETFVDSCIPNWKAE